MNGKDFIEKLSDLALPVFSLEAAGNIIQKPAGYTRSYVHRLYKKGILIKVENGLYCLPGTDEYTIASRIMPNSYITGYAALGHYGLTTQISTILQMVSPKYHRAIKLRNYEVRFSKVKKDFIYGYGLTLNGPAFAEVEKIFIDDLYLHRRQYYSEEFEDAIRRHRIDIKRLKEYAKRPGDRTVVTLAGYYLEKYGVDASDLVPFKSRAYLRLNKPGTLNKKWQVYE